MSKGTARLLFTEVIDKVFNSAYQEVQRIKEITDPKQQAEESRKEMRKIISE